MSNNISLKSKYNFVDISVLMRTGSGNYLNLTDLSLSEQTKEVKLNTESKFVITFCTFLYGLYEVTGQKKYVCDVTLEDLMGLAGIHNDSFVRRFKSNIEADTADELLATLCAKKIMDYSYGKCVLKKENGVQYDFYRQTFKDGKRVYPLICSKFFYTA